MKIINMKDAAQSMVDSELYVETAPNRSVHIDALCKEFGVPIASSWCALFVCKAHKLAIESGAPGRKMMYTASSQALLRWFTKEGLISYDPQKLLAWKGAIIIRTNPDKLHGHVALVKARFTENGKVAALGTLEGNTDVHGGSNGDGAYERRRTLPLQPYTWTFCNTTELAGGAWW